MKSDKKIDSRCLEMSVYDYFKYCNTNHFYKKGVGVITDKQSVFYSQILDGDYLVHEQIAERLEKTIHPNMKDFSVFDGAFSNNIHIFSLGREEIIIDMPENGDFSINQYRMLCNLLDEIDRFNIDFPNDKVDIIIISLSNTVSFDNINRVSEMKDKLKKLLTKNIVIDEENIIGKTLSKSECLSSIKFQADTSDCKNIKELIEKIELLYSYYSDSYYKEYLLEIFPNFINLYKLVPLLKKCENVDIKNVSINDIESTVLDNLETAVNNCQSFNDLSSSIFEVDFKSFTNPPQELNLFFKLISSINDLYVFMSLPESKRLNNCFKGSSDIMELLQMLSVFNYCYLESSLPLLKDKMTYLGEQVNKLEIEKNIIENRERLFKLFSARRQMKDIIRKCSFKISYLEMNNNIDPSVKLKQKVIFEDILSRAYRNMEAIEKKYFEITRSEMPIILFIPDELKVDENTLRTDYENSRIEVHEKQRNLDELKNILIALNIDNQVAFDSINNKLDFLDDSSSIDDELPVLTY